MKESIAALTIVGVLSALSPATAKAAVILPTFNAANFVPGAPVDNSYFSLLDSNTRVFVGQRTEDGGAVTERFELMRVGAGPTILGVPTTSRRDRAFENGVLVEVPAR